uniref:hypothetical protein n=1 Tax=Candidatus Electronema sp. TaxID=2698783 RepID=UPI004055E161
MTSILQRMADRDALPEIADPAASKRNKERLSFAYQVNKICCSIAMRLSIQSSLNLN